MSRPTGHRRIDLNDPIRAAVFKSGGKLPFHRRSDPEQATVVAIPCHQHQPDRQPALARQRQGDRAQVEEIDPRRVAHDHCLLDQEGFDRSDLVPNETTRCIHFERIRASKLGRYTARAACLVTILIALPAARGAELQVPVSIAMRGAVAEVAATFEKQTGHTVKIIPAAPGQIVASLKGGAPADVVVQIDSALPEMEDKGLVRRGRVALGTTGFGLATRSSDPTPDIATPAALKAVLLGAAKVIYNDPAITRTQ
jgi:hypothetical protein